MPDNVAFIMETGCYACDGPTKNLVRVYKDRTGQFRIEELMSIAQVGLSEYHPVNTGSVQEPTTIVNFAIADDLGQMLITICTVGICANIDGPSPDAASVVFTSTDGGITWSEIGSMDGRKWLTGFTPDGAAVTIDIESIDPFVVKYETYSENPISPTPPIKTDSYRPYLMPGEIYWHLNELDGRVTVRGSDNIVDSNGNSLLGVIAGREFSYVSLERAFKPNEVILAWTQEQRGPNVGPPDTYHYLAIVDSDETAEAYYYTPIAAYELGPWLEQGLVMASVPFKFASEGGAREYFGPVPAIVDLEAGLVHRIPRPFTDLRFGRDRVVAVQSGPFARVVNTGDCLNVCSEPRAVAEILRCYVDGVLLQDLGVTQEADGQTWVDITGPGTVTGWASAAYLER